MEALKRALTENERKCSHERKDEEILQIGKEGKYFQAEPSLLSRRSFITHLQVQVQTKKLKSMYYLSLKSDECPDEQYPPKYYMIPFFLIPLL